MWCGCEWIRHTVSALLIVELNKNGAEWWMGGAAADSCSFHTSLQPTSVGIWKFWSDLETLVEPVNLSYKHACASYDAESRQHLHFFSVNWWSKQDFPTPMSPAKKEKETYEPRSEALNLVNVALINQAWVLLTYQLWCIWKCMSSCTVQWPLWLWKRKQCS